MILRSGIRKSVYHHSRVLRANYQCLNNRCLEQRLRHSQWWTIAVRPMSLKRSQELSIGHLRSSRSNDEIRTRTNTTSLYTEMCPIVPVYTFLATFGKQSWLQRGIVLTLLEYVSTSINCGLQSLVPSTLRLSVPPDTLPRPPHGCVLDRHQLPRQFLPFRTRICAVHIDADFLNRSVPTLSI